MSKIDDAGIDTLDAMAVYLTDAQRACRAAKTSRKHADLLKAQALLDSPRFDALPDEAQDNLRRAYAEAFSAVTGAGA